MADNFYFSGLNDHRWFGQHFQPYSHFGYIGDRDNLAKYQKQKPWWRSAIEIVAPSINLTSLLTSLAGFNLSVGKTDSQLAKRIMDKLDEVENSRLVEDFLKLTQAKRRQAGYFFDSIGKQINTTNPVKDASHRGTSGQLIVVEGQLLNRSAVAQFSPMSAQQLEASTEEWMLSDFPPAGLVSQNDRFKGDMLLLTEDAGFADTFAQYLPFCRNIGWYPYCRVVGIYDSTSAKTEVFPKMSVMFVEYRRPKLIQDSRPDIFSFLQREIKTPIYLDDWSDRILTSYLLPIVAWGSNIRDYPPEPAEKEVLVQFKKFVGNDMPKSLVGWYEAAVA
jgi:hypothetical protein